MRRIIAFLALSIVVVDLSPCISQSSTARPLNSENKGAAKEVNNQLHQLNTVQIENLAVLAQVWGFLKYHHPAFTSGRRDIDSELFQILPAILAAKSHATAQRVLVQWVDSLGDVPRREVPTHLPTSGLKLKPDLGWIHDSALLGSSLCKRLGWVYRNRIPDQQHYVYIAPAPGAGNPLFPGEPDYPNTTFPDSAFQLLALFRFWNVIEYWYSYRDAAIGNWDDVLLKLIPEFASAQNKEEYAHACLHAASAIHDSHSNYGVPLEFRPPGADCRLPVNLRLVEGKGVVTGYSADPAGRDSGLEYGDAILALDGKPVDKMFAAWSPFYSFSNDTVLSRTMTNLLTNGPCGNVRVDFDRDGSVHSIESQRLAPSRAGQQNWAHDLTGATFRLLSGQIAYLKLSSLKREDIGRFITAAIGTRGLIVDVRNNPQGGLFDLGSHLVRQQTPFAVSSRADLSNPGAFYLSTPVTIEPKVPYYDGKVIILVDEETMSHAEFTAMALQAAPSAAVVGSMTAGADGNISKIPLPGGLSVWLSGIGIYYPDGTATQRVGIKVDVVVRPTLTDIRQGRDPVIEAAIHFIDPDLTIDDAKRLIPVRESVSH